MSHKYGWWLFIGCSFLRPDGSKRAELERKAIYSRTWNWVRSPNRNPLFPQFPRQPLFIEILRILANFGNNSDSRCRQVSLAICVAGLNSPYPIVLRENSNILKQFHLISLSENPIYIKLELCAAIYCTKVDPSSAIRLVAVKRALLPSAMHSVKIISA